MDRASKIEYIQLMEEQIRRNKLNKAKRVYESLYDWQRKFNAATREYEASMLMAANQCITGSTPIQVTRGTEVGSIPFLETLSLEDVRVHYWADGFVHGTDNYRAYFQGILPTYRLYLSNGQYLDCSGEHKLLTAEGNYHTIRSLVSREDVLHYSRIGEGYLASCGGDGYRCGLPPRIWSNSGLASLPSLDDVQQRNPMATWLLDVAEHTGQRIPAFLSGDLRANPGAIRHVSDLIDMFASYAASPSVELMSCLLQISQQFYLEEVDLPQLACAEHLHKIFDCCEAYSNYIFFSRSISLANGVSIIAWNQLGLQPCFDYSIPDYHNYISSGVVSHNCGKSRTGCLIDAYHLMGNYPDDWEGHKFERPPLCWLLGFSGEKTRDLLQSKLFGRFTEGKFEGGLIPAERILTHRAMTGTAGAMREVLVKHEHGTSVCQFWSYSQGQHALMGDVVDWYHIDEEPKDATIYPQVLTRTLNGDKGRGGRGILTFTPENGKTELVAKFMDDPSPGQYLQGATWDECPHLDEDTKTKILAQYPAYQRDMRSKGIPLMGSGLIFAIDEDELKCEPFEVPDYWFAINGLDFGWDHPQAHVQLVEDRDADIIYVINAWKKSKTQPYEAWHIVKPWAEGVPTAWPQDGLQTEKGSGKQQKLYYEEAGFNMLPEHATWEDGGVGVWAGIMELNERMRTGRLKIVRTLIDVFDEIRQYHTKTNSNGKIEIVKINDDILSAIRYAYMMRRYAIRVMDLFPQEQYYNPRRHHGRDSTTGY